MAIALWHLVFSQNEPPILSRWLNFLQSPDGPMVRSIQEDAWNMFLHLCETVGPDLSAYTEDDAWPSLFGKLILYPLENITGGILAGLENGGRGE